MAAAPGRGQDALGARMSHTATAASAWRVVLADLNGDGRDEALYASYEGRLACLDRAAGRELWEVDLGGFPYCLTVADIDGDERSEVLASSSALALYVFSGDGGLRWQFSCGAPLHAVAAGQLLDDGSVQIVCGGEDMTLYFLDAAGKRLKTIPVEVGPNIEAINGLAVGDVTGGPGAELCLINSFGVVRCLAPRTGETLWNSSDFSRRFMRDIELWDADGDGRNEVFASSDRVELIGGDGAILWQASPSVGRGRGYRMPYLARVEADDDPQTEMAVVYGPDLTVFDGDGSRLYGKRCDFYYFTDVAGHAKPSNEIVIGSVVGVDRSLYPVRFERGGADEFEAFQPRGDYLSGINRTLSTIRDQVLAAPAAADLSERVYPIWVTGGGPPLKQMGWIATNLAAMRAAYPYKNLDFLAFIQYREPGRKGQGRHTPTPQLLQIARNLERDGSSHVLAVAHGLDAYMSVETVGKWLDASPTTCRGIMMHENSHFVSRHLETDWPRYGTMDPFIDDFMLPVMDLCVARDKRFYLMEKQAWWAGVPAAETYARRIFAPKYRRCIVPMVEESNSRCPEINFSARVGLRRTGIVDAWGLNLIDDQLRTCKVYEHNLGDAHAALRYYVAYAAAGATEFKLGKLMYLFRPRRGDERYGLQVGELSYRPAGLLAFDTFVHMLGKGIVAPPAPEETVGVSPVVFRFQEPADGFWLSATFRDPPAIAEQSRFGLFSGHDWGLTKPHPYYASAYLMNVPRHCHQFIPETPYGLPLIVPPWTKPEQFAWVTDVVDTDGVHLLRNGRKISARDAKPELLQRFAKGARQLPFTATGVYAMGRRTGPDAYRVTLVDPGFLTPADRDAELIVNPPWRVQTVRDALSGEGLPAAAGRIRIRVPAGAFRLVDLALAR